jgi:hypothetical protein
LATEKVEAERDQDSEDQDPDRAPERVGRPHETSGMYANARRPEESTGARFSIGAIRWRIAVPRLVGPARIAAPTIARRRF